MRLTSFFPQQQKILTPIFVKKNFSVSISISKDERRKAAEKLFSVLVLGHQVFQRDFVAGYVHFADFRISEKRAVAIRPRRDDQIICPAYIQAGLRDFCGVRRIITFNAIQSKRNYFAGRYCSVGIT
jgi:hypothetical protein